MNHAGHGRAAAHPLAVLTQIRLALSFLTILPVAGQAPAAEEQVANSLGWFPLIGFALGAALCLEDWLLAPVLGVTIRSVLLILSLTVISGGLHLDGLADAADALGAGRDRARALEIMRDSRTGSFGAIALFFALALKVAALASLLGPARYVALWIAPAAGRWAMVAAASGLKYLRTQGAGSSLLGGSGRRNLYLASVIAAIGTLPFVLTRGVLAGIIVAVLLTLGIRAFYRRWLQGITGDLAGAAGELVEIAVLLVIAA